MSKITGKLFDAMSDEFTPKFLATIDADGVPNLVLVASIAPNGEDKMAFADFLMNKTAANLDGNPKVGVLVITENLEWWSMQAQMTGWEKTGDLVDRFNSQPLFRYNAYMGIRRAGKLDEMQMIDSGKVGKLTLAADFALTSLTKGGFQRPTAMPKMPFPVFEKFRRLAAVKILSYIGEDGFPVCLPVLSTISPDDRTLLFGLKTAPEKVQNLKPGTYCAVNVVTFEPVSYQVKGTFTGFSNTILGKRGVLEVDQVWNTSPPLVGDRIDIQTGA